MAERSDRPISGNNNSNNNNNNNNNSNGHGHDNRVPVRHFDGDTRNSRPRSESENQREGNRGHRGGNRGYRTDQNSSSRPSQQRWDNNRKNKEDDGVDFRHRRTTAGSWRRNDLVRPFSAQ
mmetsp:Transcript_6095/g.14793  ORF Transcript_6095/g.14793 Transcript_6095/m.14793 type:complete len:121 (+) Transcript_6095:154-516(+)